VQVYFYCIAGFTSIWLIFDVSDNISNFIDNHIAVSLVVRYYATQIPQVLIILLPVALLLSLLFALGRMSRANEIVSMLTAGVSLPRLSAPVFVIAVFLSLLSLWLNVNIVPLAKASSTQILAEQATSDPDSLLKPGVVNYSEGDPQKLLIEGKSGDWVTGFHYYQSPPPNTKSSKTYIHADRAALSMDAKNAKLRIKLNNAYFETRQPDGKVQIALVVSFILGIIGGLKSR